MTENPDDHGFEGPWWRYPPLRNALFSGLIAGAGFVLAHLLRSLRLFSHPSDPVRRRGSKCYPEPEEILRVKRHGTVLESQLMPGTSYIIRRMEYEDIPQVAQIDREAFPGEWVFRSQAAYKRVLDNPSIRYIVACRDKHARESGEQVKPRPSWFKRVFGYERRLNTREYIVGFSGFWMMVGVGHIIAIGVRDVYRQLGIGEGLLIATIELAQILNANIVTLEVRASNKIAQELYGKYGFQVTGSPVCFA